MDERRYIREFLRRFSGITVSGDGLLPPVVLQQTRFGKYMPNYWPWDWSYSLADNREWLRKQWNKFGWEQHK